MKSLHSLCLLQAVGMALAVVGCSASDTSTSLSTAKPGSLQRALVPPPFLSEYRPKYDDKLAVPGGAKRAAASKFRIGFLRSLTTYLIDSAQVVATHKQEHAPLTARLRALLDEYDALRAATVKVAPAGQPQAVSMPGGGFQNGVPPGGPIVQEQPPAFDPRILDLEKRVTECLGASMRKCAQVASNVGYSAPFAGDNGTIIYYKVGMTFGGDLLIAPEAVDVLLEYASVRQSNPAAFERLISDGISGEPGHEWMLLTSKDGRTIVNLDPGPLTTLNPERPDPEGLPDPLQPPSQKGPDDIANVRLGTLDYSNVYVYRQFDDERPPGHVRATYADISDPRAYRVDGLDPSASAFKRDVAFKKGFKGLVLTGDVDLVKGRLTWTAEPRFALPSVVGLFAEEEKPAPLKTIKGRLTIDGPTPATTLRNYKRGELYTDVKAWGASLLARQNAARSGAPAVGAQLNPPGIPGTIPAQLGVNPFGQGGPQFALPQAPPAPEDPTMKLNMDILFRFDARALGLTDD